VVYLEIASFQDATPSFTWTAFLNGYGHVLTLLLWLYLCDL